MTTSPTPQPDRALWRPRGKKKGTSPPMHITTPGLVIRQRSHEDDRVLTILTADHGVLTAYARGAKKPRGKLAASTELLCYSRFVLFLHRDRYTVDDAACEHSYFGIRQDVEKLSLAAYFAELCARLAPVTGGQGAQDYLTLMRGALHYLETGERDLKLLKPLFELRILTLSGYMPDLVACAVCGDYEAESYRLSYSQGEIICGGCAAAHPAAGTVELPPPVLAAMRHIIYSDPDRLFAFKLGDNSLVRLGQTAEGYLLTQLEQSFPTLEFYNSLALL